MTIFDNDTDSSSDDSKINELHSAMNNVKYRDGLDPNTPTHLDNILTILNSNEELYSELIRRPRFINSTLLHCLIPSSTLLPTLKILLIVFGKSRKIPRIYKRRNLLFFLTEKIYERMQDQQNNNTTDNNIYECDDSLINIIINFITCIIVNNNNVPVLIVLYEIGFFKLINGIISSSVLKLYNSIFNQVFHEPHPRDDNVGVKSDLITGAVYQINRRYFEPEIILKEIPLFLYKKGVTARNNNYREWEEGRDKVSSGDVIPNKNIRLEGGSDTNKNICCSEGGNDIFESIWNEINLDTLMDLGWEDVLNVMNYKSDGMGRLPYGFMDKMREMNYVSCGKKGGQEEKMAREQNEIFGSIIKYYKNYIVNNDDEDVDGKGEEWVTKFFISKLIQCNNRLIQNDILIILSHFTEKIDCKIFWDEGMIERVAEGLEYYCNCSHNHNNHNNHNNYYNKDCGLACVLFLFKHIFNKNVDSFYKPTYLILLSQARRHLPLFHEFIDYYYEGFIDFIKRDRYNIARALIGRIVETRGKGVVTYERDSMSDSEMMSGKDIIEDKDIVSDKDIVDAGDIVSGKDIMSGKDFVDSGDVVGDRNIMNTGENIQNNKDEMNTGDNFSHNILSGNFIGEDSE